jgi:plasmid stabilization system protein ParE
VVWTASAEDDLRQIRDYLAQAAVEIAERTTEHLVRRLQQARDFPFSGRMGPETHSRLVRELIEPPYRIMYEVFPDRIEVLTILHGARRFPR